MDVSYPEEAAKDGSKDAADLTGKIRKLKADLDAAKEILFMKEEELAAAEDVRQERDVLAQMVRTLQEREHAAGPAMRGGGDLKAAGAAAVRVV